MSSVLFSVRRRDLAWALAMVLVVSVIWVGRSDLADAGSEPPGEGIAVVYIAVGTNYPDALGVGPGSGLDGAPIILVPTNPPIQTPTANELVRLDPRKVVIIGGVSAVSQAMEDTLEALLPNAEFDRIAGSNRYETNAMFSAATFPIEGWVSLSAAAFGGNTPATDDVLSDSSIAYNTSDGLLYASIQLPHGAEVLELETTVNDNSVADDIGAWLYRVDDMGLYAAVASVGNSSFSSGHQTISTTTITAGMEIVDNATYTYAVVMYIADGEPLLINVRVRYRLGMSTG